MKLECPPPTRGSAYDSDSPKLPTTLAKAVDRLRRSELARELLGEAFVDHWLLTRDWEVRQAEKAVTDWELKRYFELA